MKKFSFVFITVLMIASFVYAVEITDPVMITSIGQSAEISIVKNMFKKAGVDSAQLTVNKLATAANVSEKGGTVVLVVGASNKGLGEARISADAEVARAKGLIDAAHKANATVVLMHIGGKERRGGQSDILCKAVAEGADFFIVKQGGNDDEYFSKIAKTNQKEFVTFNKVPDGISAIKNVYKTEAEKATSPDKKGKKEKKEKKEHPEHPDNRGNKDK